MYNHFKRLHKEFSINDYLNKDKLAKARSKKLSINSLNPHERHIVNYGRSFFMPTYNTKQQDIISYYIIEFDESQVIDILKVNIADQGHSGFFIHSVSCQSGNPLKDETYRIVFKDIIEKDSKLFEFETFGYAEHQDIAYAIDPIRNGSLFFNES